MAEDEKSYPATRAKEGICPYCGEALRDTDKCGTGQREDGVFCSLEHYGLHYAQELSERHRKRVENARSDSDG